MLTSETIAAQAVAHYARVIAGARTPAYRAPALQVETTASCTPAFAGMMRDLISRLDLADRTLCQQETGALLRYHRMYGLRQLYKRGLDGAHLLAHVDHARECQMLGYNLAVLIGDLLLRVLGAEHYDEWFPWHNFTLTLEGDRGFGVRLESLEHHLGADGRPFYASTKAPTTLLRGQRRRVAFAPHALERLAERATATRSYASLGDVFGLIDTVHYYEPALLSPREPALAIFERCDPDFFSWRYAEEILQALSPDAAYVYRVGYAPLVQDGDFALAKTILPPGFSGTPEHLALRQASFDPGVKERLLAQCSAQSYASLCTAPDFHLLRWFHQHGAAQVKRVVGTRLEVA
jgi:hypothetical protein